MYLCTSREAYTISMHMIFRHNLWMDFGVFTFDVFVCLSLFRSVFIVYNVNVMYIRCDWCAAHLYAEMFFSERCTVHGLHWIGFVVRFFDLGVYVRCFCRSLLFLSSPCSLAHSIKSVFIVHSIWMFWWCDCDRD